ncbi:MAG: hypothetical protein D6767_02225, partial [Candidatus Hydrogenedentota bacterium]
MHSFVLFQSFLQRAAALFVERGFFQIWPKLLQPAGAMEPYLDAFSIPFHKKKLFLSTSPEFFLKKIYPEVQEFFHKKDHSFYGIFSLGSAFRNEKLSESHIPEFTMLEWYHPNSSAIKETKFFLEIIAELIDHLKQEGALNCQLEKNIHTPMLLSVEELFQKEGLKLTAEISVAELKKYCHKLGM